MRVGFDMDGVIYDFRRAHADFEVGRGNTHCALDKAAGHWDYFEGWGMDIEGWLASYADGVNAGHILWEGDPLPGANAAFDALRARGHSIHIVTDRGVGVDPEGATRYWLGKHGLLCDTLTFSRDKAVVPTDIFIEDRLENADALRSAGTLCYLIDRPWNRSADDRPRVTTLAEFVRAVERHAAGKVGPMGVV